MVWTDVTWNSCPDLLCAYNPEYLCIELQSFAIVFLIVLVISIFLAWISIRFEDKKNDKQTKERKG